MPRTERLIESVRLSDEQVAELLDTLDGRECPDYTNSRKTKRCTFRSNKIVLHVLDGHGIVESSFRVVARNLSADGMAFIHGQMLPPRKKILVQLPRRGQEILHVIGQVAHCRHLDGMLHEIGVRFTSLGTSKQITTALMSLQNR